MKPRHALTDAFFLSFILMLALLPSCGKKADSRQSAATLQTTASVQEIVLINTVPTRNISKESPAYRRLSLVKSSDISAAEQLSRLLGVLGADSKVKAVVVSPAIRGTAAAFASLREKRPDLLLYAIDSEDDYLEIEEAATFVVSADQEAGAYSAAWTAARLGCTTFVYVAGQIPQGAQPAGGGTAMTRHAVLVKAAAEFKLDFKETVLRHAGPPAKNKAPVPEGVLVFDDARLLVLGMQSANEKTAFYLADETVIASMLSAVLKEGGVVAGIYPASYLMQNPELALAQNSADPTVNPSPESTAEPAKILADIEKYIGLQGGSGRFVMPGYPEGPAMEAAVIFSLQRRLVKRQEKTDSAQFLGFLRQATPNISWRVDYSMDRQTGVRSRNHLLVFQDLYLIGRGYLPFTKGTIPESYRR